LLTQRERAVNTLSRGRRCPQLMIYDIQPPTAPTSFRVCVFCGSSSGTRAIYARRARALGRGLCQRGVGLVYGGSNRGLMGVVADTVSAGGGEVIGVIPEHLLEGVVANSTLGELRVVSSMHQRKALMADLADAFIAMPGGFGTLDELFEIITWAQLGLHAKPIGLLNVGQPLVRDPVGEGGSVEQAAARHAAGMRGVSTEVAHVHRTGDPVHDPRPQVRS
jgi:uncharacterized protein (TIGR00730 family)